MRKIILASASKARKQLLRQIGLKFESARSSAKEARKLIGSCEKLVMDNARRKALDVASRYVSGLVISADTVVLVGDKIIGKPKNMRDAARTLRLLSRRPQWVYSGLAVLDIATGRLATDFEKTKVYMHPLTDEEIKSYFRRTSPLDKAGSFDIQGLGGIFIRKVEGCYYNVVGLPLAKLAKILKRFGVDIFNV